ncbi:hypothetical protein ACO2Q8_04530 [Larkinella sp. VNQ87]|uniref:hypothetical protein n=1 Tax=Larkinella sp. VNQ87 TaxID=3400921 RepID=UPI003C0616D7
MDRKALVTILTEKLDALNRDYQTSTSTPLVEAFTIVETLTDFFSGVYILGVSSPGLQQGLLQKFEVTDTIIDYLSEHLPFEAWKTIDRVRAYPTVEDLLREAALGFDYDSSNLVVAKNAELVSLY